MKKILILCLASTLLLSSCHTLGYAHFIESSDYLDFIDLLIQADLSPEYVATEELSDDSFLEAARRHYKIGSGRICIYSFATSEDMQRNVGFVSPSGSSISRQSRGRSYFVAEISWVCTPHWFSSGTIIVQYTGQNREILDFLHSVFGAPFAGGGDWCSGYCEG